MNKKIVKKQSQVSKNGPNEAATLLIDEAVATFRNPRYSRAVFHGIGFPDQLRCTLKYKETGITFSGATPAAQVFRINSLFDPNLTGVGHQPNYFDQLTAVYGQYVVLAARAEARITNENNTGNIMARCVGLYSDQNTSTQSVENLMESRFCREAYVGASNSGQAIQILKLPTIGLGLLHGQSQSQLNSDPSNYTLFLQIL